MLKTSDILWKGRDLIQMELAKQPCSQSILSPLHSQVHFY